MPYFAYDMDPANTSTNGIAQAQTTAGAANLVLNGSQVSGGVWSTTSAGYSSGVGGVRVLIDSAGDVSSVIFTVYGTDQDGLTRTEAITGVTTTEVVSTTFWQTITRIAASAPRAGIPPKVTPGNATLRVWPSNGFIAITELPKP